MGEPIKRAHDEKSNNDYVVNGAQAVCDCGTAMQYFVVPSSRRASVGAGLIGVASDVGGDNFTGHFGACSKQKGEKCIADFLPAWFHASTSVFYCEEHGESMSKLVAQYLVAKKEAEDALRAHLKRNNRFLETEIASAHQDRPIFENIMAIGIEQHDIDVLGKLLTVVNEEMLPYKAHSFALPPDLEKAEACLKKAQQLLLEIHETTVNPKKDALLTMESMLVCRRGGVVSFLTSGQATLPASADDTTPDYVERAIIQSELYKKFPELASLGFMPAYLVNPKTNIANYTKLYNRKVDLETQTITEWHTFTFYKNGKEKEVYTYEIFICTPDKLNKIIDGDYDGYNFFYDAATVGANFVDAGGIQALTQMGKDIPGPVGAAITLAGMAATIMSNSGIEGKRKKYFRQMRENIPQGSFEGTTLAEVVGAELYSKVGTKKAEQSKDEFCQEYIAIVTRVSYATYSSYVTQPTVFTYENGERL